MLGALDLECFEVAKYRLVLQARDEIHLPRYKGSAFRGAFGHALKRVVCAVRGVPCAGCMLRDRCVYACVFETPVPVGVNIPSLNTYAPHPFVIEPPMDGKRTCTPGESMDIHLILIGRALHDKGRCVLL